MKEIHTEIEIHTAPEKVWQVLADLAHWSDWNPFIYRALGKAGLGEKVDIAFKNGAKEMVLHCTVTALEPNRERRWKYHIIHPALWSGEHSMSLAPDGENGVRFIDREVIGGLLVPLLARGSDASSRLGFESMDQALKKRAEEQSVG